LRPREPEITPDRSAQRCVSTCLNPRPFQERDNLLEASLVRLSAREPPQDSRPVLAWRERCGELVKLPPRPTRLARVPQVVARGDRPPQRVLSQLGRRQPDRLLSERGRRIRRTAGASSPTRLLEHRRD